MIDDVNMDIGDVVDNDDVDWYRQEVGEEFDFGKFFVCYILFFNFQIIFFYLF